MIWKTRPGRRKKSPSIPINRTNFISFPLCLHIKDHSKTLVWCATAGKQKWKDLRVDYTAYLNSSTPPYIPKHRQPLSDSQPTVLSWVTLSDPLSNKGFDIVSDATHNQLYPLLFLSQGGCCVGASRWILWTFAQCRIYTEVFGTVELIWVMTMIQPQGEEALQVSFFLLTTFKASSQH